MALIMRVAPTRVYDEAMEPIDVDEIAEVTFSDDTSGVEVVFKDGTSRQFDGSKHPEVLAILNHWTPPTA